jgi:uncharacterized protein (DUF952 family)
MWSLQFQSRPVLQLLDLSAGFRHVSHMLIFKIFRASEWDEFERAGRTAGAPVDLSDGYIHFSTGTQVVETAAKHFSNTDGLMLLAFESDVFGDDMKWEPSRGGALFPHLYRALQLSEMLWVKPLPCDGKSHMFPEGVL